MRNRVRIDSLPVGTYFWDRDSDLGLVTSHLAHKTLAEWFSHDRRDGVPNPLPTRGDSRDELTWDRDEMVEPITPIARVTQAEIDEALASIKTAVR